MKFLNNYLDFIFESVAAGKMRLYYSEGFREILNRIYSKSNIARLLLNAENSNQITDYYTLIDVTDKNDKISLIQVNKITRVHKDLEDKEEIPFALRQKDSSFWNSSRNEMAIGRWTRRIITEVHHSTVTNPELEKFVNLYKSAFDFDAFSNFELVSGEKIRKFYHYSNYYAQRGQLGNSCMRYDECQKFLDIYVKNPEVCELLILKSEEDPSKIIGRSLIWKTDKGLYQDRAYTNQDSDIYLFREWAEKNKCVYRFDNLRGNLEVQLGNYEYNYYPYMDTFICYNPKIKILSSDDEMWPEHGFHQLQHTDGSYTSYDSVWSDYLNDYITRDDAIYCEISRDWIASDDAVYIQNKDIYVSPEVAFYSEYDDNYYLGDDAVFSHKMNIYLPKKYAIELICKDNKTDYTVKDKVELYYEHNGKYYERTLYIKNPFTEKYEFLNDGKEILAFISKLLYNIGYDDLISSAPLKDIIKDIRDSLIKDVKDIKITDDIIADIEKNPYYKYIKGVYWGISKDGMPTVEDIFNLIKAIMPIEIKNRDHSLWFLDKYSKIYQKIVGDSNKFELYKRSRLIYKMNSLSLCFDYSLLPVDIYKKYLITSLGEYL